MKMAWIKKMYGWVCGACGLLNKKGIKYGGLLAVLGTVLAVWPLQRGSDKLSLEDRMAIREAMEDVMAKHKPDQTDQAVRSVHAKASDGNVALTAQDEYVLSGLYYWGVLVDENRAKSFQLLRSAAEKGHAEALVELGIAYFKADGTKRNFVRSLDCFKRAAELDNPRALVMLGLIYAFKIGYNVVPDLERGFSYVELAAGQDYPVACLEAGVFRFFGLGCEADDKIAVEWLNKAEERGDAKIAKLAREMLQAIEQWSMNEKKRK